MCGIVGYCSSNGEIAEGRGRSALQLMLPKLRHRGPDDEGLLIRSRAGLGHTRLAIIDLEKGHQPIADEAQRRWIAFNGEIYNFKALKRKLDRHNFHTETDTEVIVHLYEEEGPNCVEKLDGMFAFALLDGQDLFLARDPLGIKPLYWGRSPDGKTLYFASEIKALMPHTRDISEFPPGHWYHSERGLQRYFDLERVASGVESEKTGLKALTKAIRVKLARAVEKRLMADVPVGVFLSGGLDSSLVALLAKERLGRLHTFAVGVEGSEDLQAARWAAKFLGTVHHERLFTQEEVLRALPKIIYHLESFDMALVRSAVANYFVAELARPYVKVVLSGEGSDELFSGYAYLKELPSRRLRRELVEITDKLHNTNLQRCDRMTMAHSIEGRVPFLDVAFMREAFAVPISLKIRREGDQPIEKWILRAAFDGELPQEILWRAKQKFSKGCGSADILKAHAQETISHDDFIRERKIKEGFTLTSKEELLYYRLFREHYPHKIALKTMGRTRCPEGN